AARSEAHERSRRPERVEVPGRNARSPACDRQQCDVEAGRQRVHAVEEVGVAGEVDIDRALDQVTDGGRLRAERTSPSVVLGMRRADDERPDAELVADSDLGDARETTSAQDAPGTSRDDEAL